MARVTLGAAGRVIAMVAIASWPVAIVSHASAQTPPTQTNVPQPFPGGGQTSVSAPKKPSVPAPTPTPTPPPSPAVPAAGPQTTAAANLGAPVYPGATALEVIDSGQGQKLYLFGTNASYAEIVAYYKNVLKSGGRELFKAPAMQQFDIGKFDDSTMLYQPSVVVKDYTWNNQDGYLFVDGTKEQRFKTIIQIVPPTIK